jgi:NADH:ubiquinone oxidoreductase subunit E
MKRPAIKVTFCCGINCSTHGGQELLNLLENDEIITKKCQIVCEECHELCRNRNNSPIVLINDELHEKMTADRLIDLIYQLIENEKSP